MKKRTCFVVLFRRFNDLDHTLPIVHVLAKNNPDINIYYLCTSDSWDFKKEEIFQTDIINFKNVYLDYFEDFILKTKIKNFKKNNL